MIYGNIMETLRDAWRDSTLYFRNLCMKTLRDAWSDSNNVVPARIHAGYGTKSRQQLFFLPANVGKNDRPKRKKTHMTKRSDDRIGGN